MNFSKVAVVAALALSHAGFAVFIPGFERGIYKADDMKIVNAVNGFEKINRADLTLTKKDGSSQPTGMILKLEGRRSQEDRTVVLVVTEVTRDACGSQTIHASLPTRNQIAL